MTEELTPLHIDEATFPVVEEMTGEEIRETAGEIQELREQLGSIASELRTAKARAKIEEAEADGRIADLLENLTQCD